MGEFRMPSLGADMESGTIVEWRVTPGDTVHRGDIVAVIDTDKSTIEVEVFEDGVVGELLVGVGDEIPVGGVLATINAAEGAAPPRLTDAAEAPAPPRPASRSEATAPPPLVRSPLVRHLAERAGVDLQALRGTDPRGLVTRHDVERAASRPSRPLATPRARRLAREHGVDLATVTGSGPRHEIYAADLRPAPTAPSSPGPPLRRTASETQRAAVAALMSRSKHEIPHYYLGTTIDLFTASEWLVRRNEPRPVHDRILPAALLLRATVLAAAANPTMNGHWRDGAFQPATGVDLGVAVSLRGGGLVAPTIRDADRLSLEELMVRLREVVAGARTGVLRSSEVTDPTITVTNIGEQGVEELFGVIYPPQVALVGFGAAVERPWAVNGMLTVRPLVKATLSADHRASDGHDGARFLGAIDRFLQRPDDL